MTVAPLTPRELALDLASFHNCDPGEALAAVRAALAGNPEPVRRFGLNASPDATLTDLLAQTGAAHGDFGYGRGIVARGM